MLVANSRFESEEPVSFGGPVMYEPSAEFTLGRGLRAIFWLFVGLLWFGGGLVVWPFKQLWKHKGMRVILFLTGFLTLSFIGWVAFIHIFGWPLVVAVVTTTVIMALLWPYMKNDFGEQTDLV